ncbi:MAG: hypothetical protein UX75_C0041G0008 [Candidatus Moranbacteria bacterium GW2011_GWE2_47_10]|nr:MAG: hypothetical protein UX75_C0041G0008 [Candidatus Moranbacteria bacterium GW2011_GWE2_47_10]
MKIIYSKERYIRHSRHVARKAFKRRQKRKAILKAKRRAMQGKSIIEKKSANKFSRYTNITAPKNFSFLENTAGVIPFLNSIERLREKNKMVYVVLKNVETIDYGAITVLLSTMFKFKEVRIGFNGDFPLNDEARRLIIESGFFEQLKKETNGRSTYHIGKDNQIITHARKNVSSELGLPIMRAATRTIWGEERICQGLQRVLVELMQNTNNHAAKDRKGGKHWWLSINHDKVRKKVSFVFMDHGVGIFSSLKNKELDSKWYGWQEIIKRVGISTDEEILKLLLDGKMHKTVTKEKFRGKGLPGIKQTLDRNQIGNLHVITNNVYANVENNDYRLLTNVFKGTFLYWELSEKNINKPWTIKY